jgi:cytidylate kinase
VGAVITISASFGAGGARVGRAVADELGLPFFDRAVPAAVAESLSVPIEDALNQDERAPSALTRLASMFAYVSMPFAGAPAADAGMRDSEQFRAETEKILHKIADTTGGVIVGRAGMMVLRDRPDVLRVRLDGPVEQRIAQATLAENLSESDARRLQRDVDAAREAYSHVFYRARQADPGLYHVNLEATSLGDAVCATAIVSAARVHLADWLKA